MNEFINEAAENTIDEAMQLIRDQNAKADYELAEAFCFGFILANSAELPEPGKIAEQFQRYFMICN